MRQRRIKPTVATHFPSLSGRFDRNPNVHMFTEDISLAVMPIGGRTDKHKDFSISFNGSNSDECERAKRLIGTISRYDKHDEKAMVCDAVEEIARHLAWEGCAVHEIICEEDSEIDLHGFTSKRLVKLPGYFLQLIPRQDWDLWKKKFVIIPAKAIWYVEMPVGLGGRAGYRRILSRLKKFEHIGPKFWRKQLESGDPKINFDFQEYVRNSAIYYSRITKTWGWNRRDWSQKRSTEFFTIYKTITFRWAQAVLREHIIAEINRLMVRLQIKCKVNVTGLPMSKEIQQIRRELEEGTVSFAAAFDKVPI